MRRLRAGVCVVVPLLAGVACAFGNETLQLPLSTPPTGVQGGEGRKIHVVAPFEDGRSEQRCGMKKNSYNIDTADVLCSQDPLYWMAYRLTEQLQAAGFEIVPDDKSFSETTLEVGGRLEVFFSEPVIHFSSVGNETDLSATLTVRTGNGLLAKRTFYVKGEESSMLVWTFSLADKSFHDAGDRIVRDMVVAILNLANRYPSLGTDPAPAQVGSTEAP